MWKSNLAQKGWAQVDNVYSSEDLLNIAESIGKIIPHPNGGIINVVSPNDSNEAMPGTLSARYGFGSFPFHTDTAFWLRPARYIVFMVKEKTEQGTTIISKSKLFTKQNENVFKLGSRSIYRVKIPSGQHYCSALFKNGKEVALRYDSCCMLPVNESAKSFNDEFLDLISGVEPEVIKWSGNNAVVIDNWTVLHGRNPIDKNTAARKLQRIYVK